MSTPGRPSTTEKPGAADPAMIPRAATSAPFSPSPAAPEAAASAAPVSVQASVPASASASAYALASAPLPASGGETPDLFGAATGITPLDPGAALLHGRALPAATSLLDALRAVASTAPFRRMVVPGGHTMSVAMTSCGAAGWSSDRRGYRYAAADPDSGRPWPAMPDALRHLAREAAAEAGFPAFDPDTCLINRYEPGARMGLHQDRDENDAAAPIVSVSLGLPATFLWGGTARRDPVRRLKLEHGDVVVWGGPSRFRFHGIAPLPRGEHPLTGPCRYNLTFRRAL